MKANSILDTIGNTPHVRVNRLFAGRAEVWSKNERSNPGASIKDRIALAMIEDAEARGALRSAWKEHADDMSADLQITMAILAQLSAVDYVDSQRLREGLRAEIAKALLEVDVLVLPTTVDVATHATADHMESGFLDPQALAGLCRFNFLGNLTGLPAASVPIGMHNGLPIGFQILGDAFDEATVLAVSAHLERLEVARAQRPKVFVDVL